MPANPSIRRRRASPASPTVRQRALEDTVGVDGDKTTPAATVEDNTDEQTTDKQTTDGTSGDEHGTKGLAATTGMETNIPAINTPSHGLHGDMPSSLTKLVTRALVLLAFFSPFLRLPAFVSPVVRPLKTPFLVLMVALYPVLYLLGSLYFISRLLYALCQDLSSALHPTPGPLRVVRQDLLTLLDLLLYPIRRLFNFIYQHLPTSLKTFSHTLPHRFSGLPNIFRRYLWLLIAYVTWLAFNYTFSFALKYRQDALLTVVCATPYVGLQLVLCQPPGSSTPRGPDLFGRIALPREKLADTAVRVGRGHGPFQMFNHYGALGDLEIFIDLSDLSKERKIELDKPLGLIIDDTSTTIKYVTSDSRIRTCHWG